MSDSKQTYRDSEDFQTEPLTDGADKRLLSKEQEPPEDKYNLIYMIFFLFGIGILLPFNAVTTAFDFFIAKMPGFLPASTYPFAINSCLGVMQIVLVIYGQHISHTIKLFPSFIITGAILILLPFIANIGGATAYWSCFGVLIFLGAFQGATQGTVFSMAAAFPFKYIGAVMIGNGIAGIGSNFFRGATLIAFPSDGGENNEFYGALTLFIFSAFICILCALAQLYVRNSEFAQFYLNPKPQPSQVDQARSIELNRSNNNSENLTAASGERERPAADFNKDIKEDKQKGSLKQFMSQALNNFKATEGLLIALLYVFILTFICFPGLSDDTHFSFLDSLKNEASWYNLLCLTLFNSFDLIGRSIGGASCADLSRKTVLVMAWIRTLFVITFLLIAFEVAPSWLFESDWFKVLNFAIFAFTNGYTSTLCAVKAPSTVEGEQKGQVGGFIGVTISIGILIGSLAALCMEPIIALTPAAKAASDA